MCHNNLKGRETEYMQNICRIYAEYMQKIYYLRQKIKMFQDY